MAEIPYPLIVFLYFDPFQIADVFFSSPEISDDYLSGNASCICELFTNLSHPHHVYDIYNYHDIFEPKNEHLLWSLWTNAIDPKLENQSNKTSDA